MEWIAAFALLVPIFSGVADGSLQNIITFSRHPIDRLVWVARIFFALPFYVVWLWLEGMPEVRSDF